MTDRRIFLQSSLALATAAGGGLAAPAAAEVSDERAPAAGQPAVSLFVFERRYPEAVRAAAHARKAGAPVWAVDGDLTALWHDHLSLAWREAPQAVAGTTTAPVLFLLETLAADHRMKVSWRDLHGPGEDRLDHALFGPAAERQDPDLVSWIITPRAAAAKA